MAEVTYYFNSHTGGWGTDPNNLDDGSDSTYAGGGVSETQTEISTSCPGDNLGYISKVEWRAKIYSGQALGSGNFLTITIKSSGGDTLNAINFNATGAPVSWYSYTELTGITKVWTELSNLQAVCLSKLASTRCYQVEILVTYLPKSNAKSQAIFIH